MTKMYFVRYFDEVTNTTGYVPVSKVLKVIWADDMHNDIIQLVNGERFETVNHDFEDSLTTVVLDR